MKTIKTLLVGLLAVFALTALSATAASAHMWRLNTEKLETAESFHSTQNLRFSETALEIECAVAQEGTLGPGAVGEIKSVKASECRSLKGCESSQAIEVEPQSGLPWKTELVTLYGGLRNRITSANAKWKIHCRVAGSSWTNYCEATPNMAIVNAKTSAEEVYDGKAPHGNCVYGSGGNFNTTGGGVLYNRVFEPFQAE